MPENPRPWRTGRKVGRTIYDASPPTEANPEGGRLIGVMDTPALAAFVVAAVNAMDALRTDEGAPLDTEPDSRPTQVVDDA
jgi:hypothetical protein